MSGYHLAQINVARLVAPVDDPRIDDFRNALARINALAEAQPGFVWRMVGEADDATDIRPYADDQIAINVSVWESPDHLAAFVYRTEHRDFLRRGREWFEPAGGPYLAMWWTPAGELPGIEACVARLEHLREHGPSLHAFDLKTRFPAPAAETVA
ncbi:MAG TPA: DUF3291 domain-containing protein [Caulobacteraceae bacterium]